MNVIKYDVEVRKKDVKWFHFNKKNEERAIKDVVYTTFKNSSNYSGNYNDSLIREWNNLDHQNLKDLNHHNYLLGYFTVKDSKVFVFEIRNEGISGKNNMAIQIYAFGSIPIENILNESFSRLKSILSSLKCILINESNIYIYPFNTSINDIESTDLKINATINSAININNRDYFKWIIVFIVSIGCLIYHSTIDDNSNLKTLLFNFFIAGLFYLFIDLLIMLIIPAIFLRNKKSLEIKVLSSVVDTPDNISERITRTENLTTPE